jgi:threonine aldolase
VQSLDEIRTARRLTGERGVAMHLDGARLWNAHVATGTPLADFGREFDTVSVCLSKGLGCPVGSVLVGSAGHIAESRVWRKRFGGGMRQAGILAAAGLWALDHHVERLADDHRRARRAAEAMAEAAPGSVDLDSVETNIVIVDVGTAGWGSAEFVSAALAEGVRTYAVGPGQVRLVWHLDVDDSATDHAIDVLTRLLAGAGMAAST